MMRSRTSLAVVWTALLLGLGALFLWFLGYFGGPVFEVYRAAKPTSGPAAVLLSGDMNLDFGMGGKIAGALADDGTPVVGINSLTFWRHRRPPADAARLLAAAVAQALPLSGNGRVLLIGQSFGADMLHVGLSNLPPAVRAKVQMVALLVPTDNVQWRASPSELFSWSEPSRPATLTARALTWAPTLCLYGLDEFHSLCPLLRQSNVWKVALPGGHRLNHDLPAVIAALGTAIDASIHR